MKSIFFILSFLFGTLFLTGCAGFQRGANVASDLRTIHVSAFENKTEFPMTGAIATQQCIDAILEDGTFIPEAYDSARLKMQAVITHCSTNSVRYDRNNAILPTEYYLTLSAKIYLFDAQTGATYIDGKVVSATDSMLTRDQYQTGVTDALPRVAKKLAQRILDELYNLPMH